MKWTFLLNVLKEFFNKKILKKDMYLTFNLSIKKR